MKVGGMVASVNRLGIIFTLTTLYGWCAVNNVLWSSSRASPRTMVAVEAFDLTPKQHVSSIRRPQQLHQETSYFAETLHQQSNQRMTLMRSFKVERYTSRVSPDVGSVRNAISIFGSLLLAMLITMNPATVFAGDLTTSDNGSANAAKSTVPISILSCGAATGSSSNCVSTASVKQVDLFMLPWTWPESISGDEVISRLKGIIASDQTLSVVDSTKVPSGDNYFFRIRAARNVCNDEIELLINPNDRVITFRSQQVDGPDSVSDFGANRRRLEDIRKRLKVVTVLGGGENTDYYSNGESTEGLTGQLKAFWGFQSGGGFESILLDEDE